MVSNPYSTTLSLLLWPTLYFVTVLTVSVHQLSLILAGLRSHHHHHFPFLRAVTFLKSTQYLLSLYYMPALHMPAIQALPKLTLVSS